MAGEEAELIVQMDDKALKTAQRLADRYMRQHHAGGLIDARTLVKVALAAHMAASGVPDDEAVALVEQIAGGLMVEPVPPNPMYHGLPWLVPGPASGAPYYG